MEGRRFDDMARLLAAGTTRRRTLKLMVAGLAGAIGMRATSSVMAGSECDETTPCDGECCAGFVCNPDTFLCKPEATCEDACRLQTDEECCEGFYCVGQICVEIPVCAPLYCSSRVSCCGNKVCLDGSGNHPGDGAFSGGSCYVRQGDPCDDHGDQGCETGECVDGYCGDPPECLPESATCTSSAQCCGDLICTAGTCAMSGSGPTDGDGDGDGNGGNGNGESDGGGAPTSLPNTGIGSGGPDDDGALIALLLAGGAAAFAARRLRSGSTRS